MDMEATNLIQTNKEANKPKQEVINQDTKVDEKNQIVITEEIKTDVVPESVMRSGETFESHYQMTMVRAKTVEGPLFKIKNPETKFTKYIEKLENGNYVTGSDLDIDKIRDETFHLGGRFAINNNQANEGRLFTMPGVTNVWLSYWQHDNEPYDVDVDSNWRGEGKQPTDEWKYMTSVERCLVEYMTTNLENHPDWDNQVRPINGGGLAINLDDQENDGFVLNVGNTQLKNSDLSYITESGDDILNLAVDKMRSRSYNEPFRWAEYKEFSQELKRFVIYLHNVKTQSPMCFSPIIDQLKLMLYSEAAHCGYDFIENYNSGFLPSGRVMVDTSVGPTMVQNVCPNHDSGREISLTWLSLTQFITYNQEGLDFYHDEHTDFTAYNWYFVPIKSKWLRGYDSRLIFSYLLALYPYPLITFEYPARLDRITALDMDNDIAVARGNDMWFEPMSSKVRVAGHTHICFVIVDWDDTKTCDAGDPFYPVDDITLIHQGGAYEIPNLHFGSSGVAHLYDGNMRGLLMSYFIQHFGEAGAATDLLNSYTTLTGWATYSDLINLVGVLTTIIGCTYKCGRQVMGECPNLMLFCGIPLIESASEGEHMIIPEPDFFQRAYALCGFVKQSAGDFIFLMNKRELSRCFSGVRYVCANIAYNEISVKGNEIPNYIIPGSSDDVNELWIEKRMRVYAQSVFKYFEYDKSIWSNEGLSSFGGLIKYRRPWVNVPGTLSSSDEALQDVQINLYCNVGDWVDLFHNFLEAKTYRITDLDEEKIKSVGGVIQQDANYVKVFLNDWKEGDYRKLLQTVFNDTYGRTHYNMTTNPFAFINNGLNNLINYRVAKIWEPVWLGGILSWNADYDRDCAETVDNWWPRIDVVPNDPKMYPTIRVLDYVYPSSYWRYDEICRFGLRLDLLYVKSIVPYIISRNLMGITYKTKEDYRLWEPLGDYKDQ